MGDQLWKRAKRAKKKIWMLFHSKTKKTVKYTKELSVDSVPDHRPKSAIAIEGICDRFKKLPKNKNAILYLEPKTERCKKCKNSINVQSFRVSGAGLRPLETAPV